MRKYQTFNSSCAYTGIANLLLRYGINVEDREIILGSNAAFQLLYNEKSNTFLAGYKVQGQEWFNFYLNTIGFNYCEVDCTISEYISRLNNNIQTHMIGFWLNEIERHVVIFEGFENLQYKYMNNKKRDSIEEDYLYFNNNDLIKINKEIVKYGYLEKMEKSYNSFNKILFDKTIVNIEKYQKLLNDNINIVKSTKMHLEERDSIYRTLLLDIQSMLDIMGYYDISDKIIQMRNKYLNALKGKNDFAIQEYFTMSEIEIVLNQYKEIVKDRIKKI